MEIADPVKEQQIKGEEEAKASKKMKLDMPQEKPIRQKRLRTARMRPSSVDDQVPHNPQEIALLREAIKLSQVQTKREPYSKPPPCPVFHPSPEEFDDPFEYIEKIRAEAEPSGICKIVPPKGWNPPFCFRDPEGQLFPTKLQRVHRLSEGKVYDDGKHYTLQTYQDMADTFKEEWLARRGKRVEAASDGHVKAEPRDAGGRPSEDDDELKEGSEEQADMLEREYWNIIETDADEIEVEYASDLETRRYGSGFPVRADGKPPPPGPCPFAPEDQNYYVNTKWNLQHMPKAEGSLLSLVCSTIDGITTPWLYAGCLFSTFCWHTEDNYLASINYMHTGAIKTWYGIPAAGARGFEEALQRHMPERFREMPDLIHALVTMISPSALKAQQVPVYHTRQHPGEFIITFPQAYHGGFNHGFNCNEAVNFAMPSWLPYGCLSVDHYRVLAQTHFKTCKGHKRVAMGSSSSSSSSSGGGRCGGGSDGSGISAPKQSLLAMERLLLQLTHVNRRLDPMSRDSLLLELKKVREEELKLRWHLQQSGICNAIHIPNAVELQPGGCVTAKQVDQIDDLDIKRQCVVCQHICCLSAVVCSCSPVNVACVRHFNQLCNCKNSDKCLVYWVKISDIDSAIARVEAVITEEAKGDAQ